MYAGVPSLVVSLWQVDDQATSSIMKSFYMNLADGMNKSSALSHAKRSFVKKQKGKLTHPIYWAPFIQIGDRTPTIITRKLNLTPWLIVVCILTIAIIGLIYLKGKRKTLRSKKG